MGSISHVHVLRTARRLVNVEYALPAGRSGGGRQPGLPGLVAGPVETVGHPVAAGQAAALVDRARRFAVEIIGRQDAVVGRHEDGGMLVTVQHPGNGRMGVCRSISMACQLCPLPVKSGRDSRPEQVCTLSTRFLSNKVSIKTKR